jgi:hypothetical protein
MGEFRPPRVRSRARILLGLVLLPLGALPFFFAGPVVLGRVQIVYTIADGKLTVFTGGLLDRERSVALDQVRLARSATLAGGRRTRGTAMPGYCVGRFTYDEFGPVWQATGCGRRAVLLKRRDGGRPWVISPPDRLGFLAKLSSGTPTRIELPDPPHSLRARLMAPLFVGLVLLIVGLEALIVLGPSRLRYRVSSGFLEVQTLFTRRRWPAEQLRARRHRAKVTLRLAGTAMPGYYTGLFRADGKTTRVYATDLKNGVLLETEGKPVGARKGPARVYLSPAEPDDFLTELREQGATVTE